MAEERPIAISSSGRLGPDEVARHTFGTARRGFDPAEVRAFLEEVARELSSGLDREQQLRKDVADAEQRAANPVLDEETLTTALGQETARVLRAAHDAATDMLKRAEAEASDLVAEAERRESQARADAEKATAEQAAALQAEREHVHRQAEQEANARLESARHDSEEMLDQATAECRSMVQQAQELRTKVLTDLTNRRRILHLQIEQLRAGRERLSETIQGARESVDDIADELLRAEDDARLAAEAAGRSAAGLPDHDADEMPPVLSEGLEGAVGESPSAELSSVSVISDSPFDQASGAGEPTARKETHPFAAEVAPDPGVEASSADGDSSGDDANGVGHDRQVEDLFARLRASSLGDGPGSSDAGDAGDAGGTTRAAGPSISSDSTSESPRGGAAPSAIAEASAPASADSDDEPTLELARPLQLVRRDELLGPVIAGLARRVKRALQDDQNDILDRLRSQGGWKDGVLPELSEHTARYVGASKEMLAEAARAGSTFAGLSIERAEDIGPEADSLANALVVPLRRRLEEDCPTVDPTDDAALVEHVGAAFREWRGDRTERLAGDHATAAFAASAVAGTSRDVTIRWIVDDEGAPCADCEDNALAEDVSPGDPFPTGHPHPPAHSGCRCLLVVTET